MHYLVLVDRFSGYPMVASLRALNTTSVVTHISRWFYDYGFPERLMTDGGPQFRSEFKEFCASHRIEHIVSSPYHAQSNGLAEAAVKNVKHLLVKLGSFVEFQRQLLQWRNMPRSVGTLSPAELFFGRQQRRGLPCLPASRDLPTCQTPAPPPSAGVPLHPLAVGALVRMQNPISKVWSRTGVVTAIRDSGRSYAVESEGNSYIRNRIYLRHLSDRTERAPVLMSASSAISPDVSVVDIPRRSTRIASRQPATYAQVAAVPPSPCITAATTTTTATPWAPRTPRTTASTRSRSSTRVRRTRAVRPDSMCLNYTPPRRGSVL